MSDTSKYSNSNIVKRIDKIFMSADASESAKDFCHSLKKYFLKNKELTLRQYEALEKIESYCATGGDRKFSEEWKNNSDLLDKFKLVAPYLERCGWQADLAKKVVSGSYMPTRREYDRVINNKYVKKILAEIESTPKYEQEALVTIRAVNSHQRRELSSVIGSHNLRKAFVVVKVNSSAPISAVNGGKRYLILPFGDNKTYEVEERYLKKYKPPRAEIKDQQSSRESIGFI